MKYLLTFIFFFSSFSFAVELTTADGIRIKADSVTANLNEGIVIHSGNVVVSQGSMTFKAHKIEVIRTNGVISKLVAKGQPMVFIDKLATSEGLHSGEASELIYVSTESKVTIKEYKLKDTEGNSQSGKLGVYLLN
jgi:lipopolysaccharide transport protein LptA